MQIYHIYIIYIVAIFQINMPFAMYMVTHSRLAKKLLCKPSIQHNFSSHTFLTGQYPYHPSQGSKQQGKKELHILCATQYKFYRLLPHISVEHCICDIRYSSNVTLHPWAVYSRVWVFNSQVCWLLNDLRAMLASEQRSISGYNYSW